jgi:hypothetical protein
MIVRDSRNGQTESGILAIAGFAIRRPVSLFVRNLLHWLGGPNRRRIGGIRALRIGVLRMNLVVAMGRHESRDAKED